MIYIARVWKDNKQHFIIADNMQQYEEQLKQYDNYVIDRSVIQNDLGEVIVLKKGSK
ncbi:hypothetical protein [Tepidibacillus fermentans]|uniref:Uncharacterized protein n=1 Tax=Tepidibacillus fermentans TaxID=1281767 RepID=A0A4R3KBI5_9BACI|nr:hypothetical protein [Tepidibacillus fermentans]TCS80350.1 hypothetical protein EDD72_11717 [Tepidibacillus fermentans]